MKETEDTQRTLSDFCLEVEVGKMGFRVGMAMGLGELGSCPHHWPQCSCKMMGNGPENSHRHLASRHQRRFAHSEPKSWWEWDFLFFDLTKGVVVWLGSIFGRLIYRRTACYIFARLFLNYYTFQNVANTQNVKYYSTAAWRALIYINVQRVAATLYGWMHKINKVMARQS